MQDPTITNNQNQPIQSAGVTPPPASNMGAAATPAEPMMQFTSTAQLNTAPTQQVPSQPGMQSAPTVSSTTPGTTPQPPAGASSADSSAVNPATSSPKDMTVSSQKEEKPMEKDEKKADEKAKDGQPQVKKADIETVVSNWTGIPITKLTEDEGAKLLNLENRIHKRLIDQEEAVTAVAEAVRRGRIGLAAANRPIASFIFLGPSGTGKTELAKTLAEILFGRDDAMVRLDMSEYMEKHEVAKLIGAPPGYVGYEEGGQLTEAVRAKPYSIVLLDEVEKAHPDVFNILLQLLEDGRLTDNKGNTISFKNTIVICTSNIGSAQITQRLGEKDGKTQTGEQLQKEFEGLSSEVSVELRKFFRPELLNRYDDIVIFKPLRREDMASIAKLGIEKTGKLLKEQDLKLQISDKALQQLAIEGYDPMYGARPLRRLIQTSIENPIAVLIIAKTFSAGDTIMIDYDQTKSDYSFRKATPEEVAKEENAKDKKDDTKDASSSPDPKKEENTDSKPTDNQNTNANSVKTQNPATPAGTSPNVANGQADASLQPQSTSAETSSIPGVVPPPPTPETPPAGSQSTSSNGIGIGQPQ